MNREELSYEPCDAAKSDAEIDAILEQMIKDGTTSTYRRVFMCGKPAKVYMVGDSYLAFCDEHKHLAD